MYVGLFFATFLGFFLCAYRDSNFKGLKRFSKAIKIAGIATWIWLNTVLGLPRLASAKTKIYELPMRAVHERLLPSQEFNNLKASHNSGKMIQTGTGTILAVSQKADQTADFKESKFVEGNSKQITLAKDINNSGNLGKSGPGPRAKAEARARTRTGVADAFSTPSRDYSPYHKPLSGKQPAKVLKSPFDQDQNQKQGSCKSPRIEIVSKIEKGSRLAKEAAVMGKNQDVQREVNHLINELSKGNFNPGTGTKNLFKDICYVRGKEGARVFYRIRNGVIEILGKANKNNETKVIKILTKMYK